MTLVCLASKPTNPKISRWIVVKFIPFQTKQRILYKGWGTKDLQFEGNRITLDHDYSIALQRRHKEYGEIKRQLRERRTKFRSSYPALLKVSLDDGEKTTETSGNHNHTVGAYGEGASSAGMACPASPRMRA
ncbi:hypothetical protein F2P81_024060 [Scophthalmus maximus]|uniref:Uncharacterized protein n=1 Tax=Scophthalmus maximus TaxID=52904 RepID=A0A6A4RVN6_SCOMX|nr:hypothetical protein F2P81_024060 [Scophthalmus maximus]